MTKGDLVQYIGLVDRPPPFGIIVEVIVRHDVTSYVVSFGDEGVHEVERTEIVRVPDRIISCNPAGDKV